MKIMHIIIGLHRGGAETFLKRLIFSHLNSQHIQHMVVSLTDLGKIGKELTSIGVRTYTIELTSFFYIPKSILKLVKILKKENPDIVQTWMYHANLIGSIASLFCLNKNIIWNIRCSAFIKQASIPTKIIIILNVLLSHILPKKIIANSSIAIEDHVALGFPRKKMNFIPNGYNLSDFEINNKSIDNQKSNININDNEIVIGNIGRYHPMKDHYNFIDAAFIVHSNFPNTKFIMIGRDISLSNANLSSQIKRLNLESAFILLGEKNDIPTYLGLFDIYCSSSSSSEGFPNVVAESMLMCVPCVVTDVGESAIIVGKTGVIVPPKNALALADGIIQLIKLSNEERKELGHDARKRIGNRYSIDSIKTEYELLYKKVLN